MRLAFSDILDAEVRLALVVALSEILDAEVRLAFFVFFRVSLNALRTSGGISLERLVGQ